MKNSSLYIGLFGLTFFAQAAQAELALGAGLAVFQNPQKGFDAEKIALPLVSYQGERLSFRVTTLSYRIASLGELEINAQVSGRIQGYEAADSLYLDGMKTRSNTLDGGISLDWHGFSLSYKHDLLAKYKGDELALTYSKGFEFGKLQLITGAGVTWQSEKLNHYYFGVDAAEAKTFNVENTLFNRHYYQTEAALVPKINALGIYSLSKSWALIGGAEVEFLPNEITDSPIIGEKNAWGVFAGLVRNF